MNAILVVPQATGGLVEIQLYLADSDFAPIIRTVLQTPLKQYENYLRARRGVQVRYTGLPGKPATAFEFIYSVLLPMLMFFPAFVAGSMVINALTEEVENNTLPTAAFRAALDQRHRQCQDQRGRHPGGHPVQRLAGPALAEPYLRPESGLGAQPGGHRRRHHRHRRGPGGGPVPRPRRAQFVYSLALLAAIAITTLLGLSPIQTLSRLAIGDYYTGGLNVLLFALFLAALWLLLRKLSHRLVN